MKRGRFWKAMQFQPHRLKIFWFLLGNDMPYTSSSNHTLFATYLNICFRICSSDGSKSCKHTAIEVLDYDGSSKLEAKINADCDDDCKKMRDLTVKDIDMIEKNATKLFAKEETKISMAINALNVISTVMKLFLFLQ